MSGTSKIWTRVDFDKDGRLDLVTIGESFPGPVSLIEGQAPSNAWIQVFRGVRGGGFSTTPLTLGPGGPRAALPLVHGLHSGDRNLVALGDQIGG